MEVNGYEETCARCGGVIGPERARGYVEGRPRRGGRRRQWLCWRCARPTAVRTFWTFDPAAAARRRQERHGLIS